MMQKHSLRGKYESERGREDGAGHYVMESLEEPRLCESPPMWDGLYVWTRIDRMGSRIPVICYVYQCARLLTLAYSHARYFTEIYFSRIVILGVAGKKVIFKDWWMRWRRCVCGGVREVLRWPVGNSSSCIYIYLYVFYPYTYKYFLITLMML